MVQKLVSVDCVGKFAWLPWFVMIVTLLGHLWRVLLGENSYSDRPSLTHHFLVGDGGDWFRSLSVFTDRVRKSA